MKVAEEHSVEKKNTIAVKNSKKNKLQKDNEESEIVKNEGSPRMKIINVKKIKKEKRRSW